MTEGASLQREYRDRFSGKEDYRESVWKVLCDGFFSRFVPSNSIVLDLGAGWGEFVRNVTAQAKYAMDLNPDCGARVEGYATFLNQDCASRWPFGDSSLDVVFSSNFLEHLESKSSIDRALQEAFRCLKPGGRIILLGPNARFLGGSYWNYWDHHVPITDHSIAEALRLSGFVVTEEFDRFLPYSMSDGLRPPIFVLRIYLKMRAAWRFFGRQFLVVAEKPGSLTVL